MILTVVVVVVVVVVVLLLLLLRSISEISSCLFGPRPWHIEIRHRVKKTSTINLFGFETLKLKIRILKLWKPTVLHYSISYYTITYCTILYYTILYYAMLCYAMQYCTTNNNMVVAVVKDYSAECPGGGHRGGAGYFANY